MYILSGGRHHRQNRFWTNLVEFWSEYSQLILESYPLVKISINESLLTHVSSTIYFFITDSHGVLGEGYMDSHKSRLHTYATGSKSVEFAK